MEQDPSVFPSKNPKCHFFSLVTFPPKPSGGLKPLHFPPFPLPLALKCIHFLLDFPFRCFTQLSPLTEAPNSPLPSGIPFPPSLLLIFLRFAIHSPLNFFPWIADAPAFIFWISLFARRSNARCSTSGSLSEKGINHSSLSINTMKSGNLEMWCIFFWWKLQ